MRKLMIAVAVLATVSLAMWLQSGASAGSLSSVTGGGAKDYFSFAGAVQEMPDGSLQGRFVIIVHDSQVCHYSDFQDLTVTGNAAHFEMFGVCVGPFGPYAVHNRVGIIDSGEPGIGQDVIDVNFIGPVGVAIPGGVLDAGNFQVKGG